MSDPLPTFDYSIPITTFHRIPWDTAARLIPNGTKITKSDHFYNIPFELETDMNQLHQWVKDNSLGGDKDLNAMAKLMDQQKSPDNP